MVYDKPGRYWVDPWQSAALCCSCAHRTVSLLYLVRQTSFLLSYMYIDAVYTHVYMCMTAQRKSAWPNRAGLLSDEQRNNIYIYMYFVGLDTCFYTYTFFGLWVWALAWYQRLHFMFRSIWAWAQNSLGQPQTQHVSQPSACLHVCHQHVPNRACESACESACASYAKAIVGTCKHDVSGPAIATNNIAHIQSLTIALQSLF